ncbi:hypothetical protein GCM10009780_02090 [Actinomadura alba]
MLAGGDDLNAHAIGYRGDEMFELFTHHLGATDLAIEHALVEYADQVRRRRILSGEDALTGQAGRHRRVVGVE